MLRGITSQVRNLRVAHDVKISYHSLRVDNVTRGFSNETCHFDRFLSLFLYLHSDKKHALYIYHTFIISTFTIVN